MSSIRDELVAAFSGEPETPETPAAPISGAAETPAAPAPEATDAGGEKPRDESGRFTKAPKQTTSKEPEPQTTEAGKEQAATPAIRPPASWDAAAKAQFASLPQWAIDQITKRESDVDKGFAQHQSKAERFNALEQLLAPRRERFALAGINETQAVQALFAAQDMLERSPVEAIAYLARQYGVDLARYANPQGGQQPQQQLSPQFAQMANRLNTLEAQAAQQQQASQQAKYAQIQADIAAVRNDPKNLYFDNVERHMAALITSGQATSIQDAYDKAVWADPQIRSLLMKAQQDEADKAAKEAASAKARAARHASGSVTGSPTPGSSPAQQSGSVGSVGDDLRAAFREHAA